MSDTQQLGKDLLAAHLRYAEAAQSGATEEDLQAIREQIHEVRAAVADSISSGAIPCPDCGGKVHGMQKREGTENAPPQYEVGCLNCPDHRARGWSEQQAVEKWNQGVKSETREGWVAPTTPPAEMVPEEPQA